MIRRLVSEPLVQFIVLGATLFWLSSAHNASTSAVGDEIRVTADTVRHIANAFEGTWQRPPTPEELQVQIENYVREEIYNREARSLGLDVNDVIIRRRLQQKFQFLLDDSATAEKPSDTELLEYFEEHLTRFSRPATVSFDQVYFDEQGSSANMNIKEAERILKRGDFDGAILSLGDAFPWPHTVKGATLQDVADVYGESFAAKLDALPIGYWTGPIRSNYGNHLVRVTQKIPQSSKSLDSVRNIVEQEWRLDRRQEKSEALYQELRSRYKIVRDDAVHLSKRDAGTDNAQ